MSVHVLLKISFLISPDDVVPVDSDFEIFIAGGAGKNCNMKAKLSPQVGAREVDWTGGRQAVIGLWLVRCSKLCCLVQSVNSNLHQ